MRLPICALILAGSAFAQSCPSPAIEPLLRNLDFAEGTLADSPAGWAAPCGVPYEARVVEGAGCFRGHRCALVALTGNRGDSGTLSQTIDARRYRGTRFVFHAAIRADVAAGSAGRLFARVHHLDGSESFSDDMGNYPAAPDIWMIHELVVPVTVDARDIEFGVELDGAGTAFIDDVSLRFQMRNELLVRALLERFAAARNARDAEGIASAFMEEGRFNGVQGGAAIAAMLTRDRRPVGRVIHKVEQVAPEFYVVRGEAYFEDRTSRTEDYVISRPATARDWLILSVLQYGSPLGDQGTAPNLGLIQGNAVPRR